MSNSKHTVQLPLLAVLAIVIIIVAGDALLRVKQVSTPLTQSTTAPQEIITLQLNNQPFQVILAETPAEIKQGLSYRQEIGADGMLFLLQPDSRPTFWMYEMKFPLDFIWINDDTVVQLNANVPHPKPDASAAEIEYIPAEQPVDAVLEVPAGFIKEHSIEIGHSVKRSVIE